MTSVDGPPNGPVPDVPLEHARRAHWVESVLVADIAYRHWTPDNRLRHAVWRGLRAGKPSAGAHRAPDAIPPPSHGEVEGAYRTRRGQWGVEAVRRRQDQFFRLIHAGNILDGFDIATVEQLLAQAGVNMAGLVPADTTPPLAAEPGVA